MEPFATLDELETRYRVLDADESKRAVALLDDASFVLRREFELAGVEINAADEIQAHNLSAVCCSMVKRVLANGVAGDYKQYSQTAGSFNEQYTFANPQGDIYLTSQERRLLGIKKRRTRVAFLRPRKDE